MLIVDVQSGGKRDQFEFLDLQSYDGNVVPPVLGAATQVLNALGGASDC